MVEGNEATEGVGKRKILGIKNLEKSLIKEMTPIVEQHRLWTEWLRGIKGISILTAAKLIAYFEPYWAELEVPLYMKKKHEGKLLTKPQFKTVKFYTPKSRSSLIKLCGYAVDDATGLAYRRVQHKSVVGNQEYRKTFYIIFESILKRKGKCYELWRRYHEDMKGKKYAKYLKKWFGATTRKEAKKLHPKTYIQSVLDLSRRRFIKTFISILWEKYQEIYRLPIPPPQHVKNLVPLKPNEWIHPLDLCDRVAKI
jgi:hypothetical protein